MQDPSLFEYVLRLSDDSLILGQRLGEWCGHGPILEEDIALTNISLDLIGQAISLYEQASDILGALGAYAFLSASTARDDAGAQAMAARTGGSVESMEGAAIASAEPMLAALLSCSVQARSTKLMPQRYARMGRCSSSPQQRSLN